MKKLTITALLLAWGIFLFAQGIYNDGAHIVSTSGSYWVLDNGGFTLTSASATNLAQLDNLSIEGDASLTLPANTNLTVNGTLNNKSGATLTVNSGGSLITNGTITNDGTISMIQTLTGAAQAWHMISGPAVAGITLNDWDPGISDDFYAWLETDPGTWVNYKNTTTSPTFLEVNGSDNFVAGKGYLAAYNSSNPTKSITGTPNTGSVTFTLKNSSSKSWTYTGGWNLLGNPYPSAIDWNAVDHSETSLFQDNFAYIYDPNKSGGAAYITIDGGSADAFIAPFQGFMVIAKTTSNNDPFTFTNAMRDHGGSFLKNQTASDGLLLRLSHENWYDEATIRLRDESELNRDRQDALKLFSYNPAVPQIFSLSADRVSLAVNSIPAAEAGDAIPLGVLFPAEGNYTISLQQYDESFDPFNLFLEDRLLGIFHKLSEQAYAFTASAGEVTDRFYLHFGMLDLPENSLTSRVLIWQQDNIIKLTGLDEFTQIQLFDINGRLLWNTKLNPADQHQFAAPKTTGVYMVRLINTKLTHTQKIVIH